MKQRSTKSIMKAGNYNINIKRGVFVLLITILIALPMHSQVSIGTEIPPLKGALLDLKESNKPDGSANALKGLMMARVELTDINNLTPILQSTEPGYATLKLGYAGLIVYNVGVNPPLEKGLYFWNGTKWEKANTLSQGASVDAENGLTASNNTISLGGELEEHTTIDLKNFNLKFNENGSGKIGLNLPAPKVPYALLDVANNNDNADPLILNGVKSVSDTYGGVASQKFYELRASESGVIRKIEQVVKNTSSFVKILRSTGTESSTTPPTLMIYKGNTDGSGTSGHPLVWYGGDVTLPESGTYVFSFRFYGHTTGWSDNVTASFFLSAFKNSSLYSTHEMVIANMNTWHEATYSINITVTGDTGNVITFQVGKKGAGSNISVTNKWYLVDQGNIVKANRTSMVYWKLQ